MVPRDRLVDRMLPASFTGWISDAKREELARRLSERIDNEPALRGQSVVPYPCRTHIYWSYRCSDRSGQIGR